MNKQTKSLFSFPSTFVEAFLGWRQILFLILFPYQGSVRHPPTVFSYECCSLLVAGEGSNRKAGDQKDPAGAGAPPLPTTCFLPGPFLWVSSFQALRPLSPLGLNVHLKRLSGPGQRGHLDMETLRKGVGF
jgi:hypothetical protein